MDLQMLRHKWFQTDDGRDVCSLCAQPDFPEVGIFCPGKKPATPQPPEWKIAPVPQALLELAEMERKARQEVCGITDLMRGVSPSAVSAAALPDPPCRYCGMLAGAHREDCNRPDPPPWRYHPGDCPDLSRAMSTPLPHDPDIRTRLMPWRNK